MADVRIISANELTSSQLGRWAEIQDSEPMLASPYFCPEFTQAVAEVRGDVYVAVIGNRTQADGFFPFQRGRFGTGRPVGGRVSDYHGAVVDFRLDWSPLTVLRAARLSSWEFDHLPPAQRPFLPYRASVADSHYVPLTGGFTAYERHLKNAGATLLSKHAQCLRRVEREIGPVRFEPNVVDEGALGQVIAWKSAQYRRSGLVDLFSFSWARRLLERLLYLRNANFSGVLSALYAGGRLIAGHFGMRSRSVWHWWFPAHDPELHRYSPGMVLLLEAIRTAADSGCRELDLGKGDAFYKDRLRGETRPLAAGRVEIPSLTTSLRRAARTAESWIRHSPLLPLVRAPGRLITRLERRSRYQ